MSRPALLFAGVLACAPPGPAPPTECDVKVEAMRTLFASGPVDFYDIRTLPGLQLPVSRRGEPLGAGIPLFVRADGSFVLDNAPFADVAALMVRLGDEVEKSVMMAENTGQPWTPTFNLMADARAPVNTLVGLAEALPPGTRYALVVSVADDFVPVPPPVPPALQAVLQLSADERSWKMGGVMTAATGSCTAVQDVFGSIADTPPEERGKRIFDDVPTALAACKCEGVDVETVAAALWALNGKTEPAKRQFPLPLTNDPKAPTSEYRDSTTFAELVGHVEGRADQPIRLVKPPPARKR